MADKTLAILFVEADGDARRVLGRFLGRWGKLKTASRLQEARTLLSTHAPELLVLDPELAEGDGLELIAELRAVIPWAQVLIVSASDKADRMGAYIAAGANDVVTRPFDIGTLEGRVLRLKKALPVRRVEFEHLKQLEARVRHLDAIAMLGTFAATIAHEVAGPLGAIMANAEMLQNGLRATTMTVEDRNNALASVRDIHLATRVIQDFITRVRRSARRDELLFVHESLASVLDTTRMFLKQRIIFSRAHVQWPAPEQVPSLEHLPMRLTQALTNAVANALDAVGQEGRVQIECLEEGDTVTVSVADDGPGLTGESLHRALQPFYTSKPGGTGLGMSVIGDVVREHGGELIFGTGLEGRGLSVQMVLPRSQAAPKGV